MSLGNPRAMAVLAAIRMAHSSLVLLLTVLDRTLMDMLYATSSAQQTPTPPRALIPSPVVVGAQPPTAFRAGVVVAVTAGHGRNCPPLLRDATGAPGLPGAGRSHGQDPPLAVVAQSVAADGPAGRRLRSEVFIADGAAIDAARHIASERP